MILRRLLRRGPDAKTTAALVEILAQRSVTARAVANPDELFKQFTWPPASRARAVLELDAAPLTHLILTRIVESTAVHGGKMSLIGAHVLVDRSALPAVWAGDWGVTIRAHPKDHAGGLGAPRDFDWQADDASIVEAGRAAAALDANDRVQRRVMGVLREPATMQFEIVPIGPAVRVTVYQGGRELPDPTAVEALLTVARALPD